MSGCFIKARELHFESCIVDGEINQTIRNVKEVTKRVKILTAERLSS